MNGKTWPAATLISIAWCLTLALGRPLSAADGARPGTIEKARSQVDARGRVTDESLIKQTGWRTMHAIGWKIELERPPRSGKFVPVSGKRDFHHGEVFRLRIETATDLHAYVLVHNSDGSEQILLPELPKWKVPLIRRGETVFLPASNGFRFEPPTGTERLHFVFASKELPWVSSKRFWELENGEMLTEDQQATLSQLKSIRKANLRKAAKQLRSKTKKEKSVGSTAKQINEKSLTRGIEILAVEPSTQSELISYATSQVDANPIIVFDITLKHVE